MILVELAHKNAAASFTSRRNVRDDAEATLGPATAEIGAGKTSARDRVLRHLAHSRAPRRLPRWSCLWMPKPDKSRYRTYKIRQAESPDDFACMYEVLSRRFRRARESAESEASLDTWRLPDLLVVDGGKGQLGVALAAARDTGIDVRPGVVCPSLRWPKSATSSAPVSAAHRCVRRKTAAGSRSSNVLTACSCRKPRTRIPIRANSAEMFVLQRLRDEAHRFAVTFPAGSARNAPCIPSWSRVPGIGPARQRDLLRHFGKSEKVQQASLADLLAVPGLTRKAASASTTTSPPTRRGTCVRPLSRRSHQELVSRILRGRLSWRTASGRSGRRAAAEPGELVRCVELRFPVGDGPTKRANPEGCR